MDSYQPIYDAVRSRISGGNPIDWLITPAGRLALQQDKTDG